MAKKQFEILNADWASEHLGEQVEEGDGRELDLTADEERALVAAGWIQEPTTKKKKEG